MQKATYFIPNGDRFVATTNERDAKRIAREQPEGSQWYTKEYKVQINHYSPQWTVEYRNTFSNGRWSHRK